MSRISRMVLHLDDGEVMELDGQSLRKAIASVISQRTDRVVTDSDPAIDLIEQSFVGGLREGLRGEG